MAAVLGLLALTLWYQFIYATKGDRIEKILQGEFGLIRRLPQAFPVSYHTSGGSSAALVSESYKTDLSYSEIRTYYDHELARNGWAFKREEKIKDWGRDLGGKSAVYCKGTYRASLQYAGTDAHYGWDFAFSLSWGLDSLYDKFKGRVCE